jgi:hypothetical protein
MMTYIVGLLQSVMKFIHGATANGGSRSSGSRSWSVWCSSLLT